jgi:hypothetical protein
VILPLLVFPAITHRHKWMILAKYISQGSLIHREENTVAYQQYLCFYDSFRAWVDSPMGPGNYRQMNV